MHRPAGIRYYLTPREREVFFLFAQGWDDHEIAAQLHLRPNGANTVLWRLCQRAGAQNRVQLVGVLLRHAVVTLAEIVEAAA